MQSLLQEQQLAVSKFIEWFQSSPQGMHTAVALQDALTPTVDQDVIVDLINWDGKSMYIIYDMAHRHTSIHMVHVRTYTHMRARIHTHTHTQN